MTKKLPSGFIPIPFKLVGKTILPISLVLIVVGGMDYLVGWAIIPPVILFVGLGLLIISLYLRFVVPDE